MSDFDFDRSSLSDPTSTDWPRYVGSTDKKGHGKLLHVQFPPETIAQLDALVASKDIPDYRTTHDALRTYAMWGMKMDAILIKDTNPVRANELMLTARRVSRQMQVENEERLLQEDQTSASKMRYIMRHQASPSRVKACRDMLEDMFDEDLRRQLEGDVRYWAGSEVL